jgi:hypothetical protein
MPTNTYTPIASVTLSDTASQVVFSGLPQTFRDLIVVASASGTVNDQGMRLRFNGDSGSNYSTVAMGGWSNTAFSFQTTTTHALFYSIQIGVNTNGIHTPVIGQIMDYSATDKHKTLLTRANGQNNSTTETTALATRWANTSAINSMSFTLSSGSFASGSTFTVFGVIA